MYDPLSDRIYHVLSMSEALIFWSLRFRKDILEIRENFPLIPRYVRQVCMENKLPVPRHILSTDMLITYKDGRMKAVSIKDKKDAFMPETAGSIREYEQRVKNLRRRAIEEKYWEIFHIPFECRFAEDVDRKEAQNIRAVMKCYDMDRVTTIDQKLRFLIAHRVIQADLRGKLIPFAAIAAEKEAEIEGLYQKEVGKICCSTDISMK